MANRPMKRCSTSLVIRGIKITMRYRFILMKMIKIQKTDNTRYWWAWEYRNSHTEQIGRKNGMATLASCLTVSNTTKYSLSKLRPSKFLYPKEMKIYIHKNTYVKNIHGSFIIASPWKRDRCLPAREWVNKICYFHIMEY